MNMNDQFETMMHSAQKQVLTSKEKELLYGTIRDVMNNHPIVQKTSSVSPWMNYLAHHVRMVATIAVLFFVVTSSVFAEQAIPGDIFYGVKTGVNEKVLGWFATSVQSKEEWQLAIADRRLNEIQHLSMKQKLSPELQAKLEEQIKTRTATFDSDDVQRNEASNIPDNQIIQKEVSVQEETAPKAAMMTTTVSVNVEPQKEDFSAKKIAQPLIQDVDIENIKNELVAEKTNLEKAKNRLRKIGMYTKVRARIIRAENSIFNAEQSLKHGETEQAYIQVQVARKLLQCSVSIINTQDDGSSSLISQSCGSLLNKDQEEESSSRIEILDQKNSDSNQEGKVQGAHSDEEISDDSQKSISNVRSSIQLKPDLLRKNQSE